MDEMVKAALAKWPNVPHCYGWLGLDSRGQWYMRDDRAQAAGPFAGEHKGQRASSASKGSLLRHDKLIEFIGRNYEPDPQGQWFFQNGPQRVYVELECAPWVWRVDDAGQVQSHTGQAVTWRSLFTDELGRLLIDTERGLGLVHTQDVWRAAERMEAGQWPQPTEVFSADLPARFAFVPSPAAAQLQA